MDMHGILLFIDMYDLLVGYWWHISGKEHTTHAVYTVTIQYIHTRHMQIHTKDMYNIMYVYIYYMHTYII